jgi:hypothetical protein
MLSVLLRITVSDYLFGIFKLLLSHIMLYRVHLAGAGFELAMLMVIGTDCIGSCNQTTIQLIDLIDFFCVLTPLSAIFQLYHGDQF